MEVALPSATLQLNLDVAIDKVGEAHFALGEDVFAHCHGIQTNSVVRYTCWRSA